MIRLINRVNYNGKNNYKRAETFLDLNTNFFPKIIDLYKNKESNENSRINHLKNSRMKLGHFPKPNVKNYIVYHDQLIDDMMKNSPTHLNYKQRS